MNPMKERIWRRSMLMESHSAITKSRFSEIHIRFKSFASSTCFLINLCIR
jgi:hypothetical protein